MFRWLKSGKMSGNRTNDEKEQAGFALQNMRSVTYIDLSNPNLLTSQQELLLVALLNTPLEKNSSQKFSKEKNHAVTIGKETVYIALSHSLRKVTFDRRSVFEVVDKGDSQENVLGAGSFGKVQKSIYVIELNNDDQLQIYRQERADKKQKLQVDKESESEFIKRIKSEYIAAKSLYYLDEVGKPLIYKNSKQELVAHISFPYVGQSLDKVDINHLPIGNLINLIISLFQQLKHFHDLGFAHRDIKPANTTYDAEYARLSLLDPGLAMLGTTQTYIGGTAIYLHQVFFELAQIDKRVDTEDAKKGDVYALALTTGVICGLTESYLLACCKNRIRPDFNLINVDNPACKAMLVELLNAMTDSDLNNIPDMNYCLSTLMEIQKTLYVEAIEELEEGLTTAATIIETDTKQKSFTTEKITAFLTIQDEIRNLRNEIDIEKARAPEILAQKGHYEILNVPRTTITADYKEFHQRTKAIRKKFRDNDFEEEESCFKKFIASHFSACFCFFSSSEKTTTANKIQDALTLKPKEQLAYRIK